MATKGKNAHKVGYKNPPAHSQFKKGQSGNPKGRPKQEVSMLNTLCRVLGENVSVRIGDEVIRMPAFEAMIRAHAINAAKGDVKAFKIFVSLVRELGLMADTDGEGQRHGVLVVPQTVKREDWAEYVKDHLGENGNIPYRPPWGGNQ